jgi:hypothetical protein
VNVVVLARGRDVDRPAYRPTLLLVAGFAVSLLSLQRVDQRLLRPEAERAAPLASSPPDVKAVTVSTVRRD